MYWGFNHKKKRAGFHLWGRSPVFLVKKKEIRMMWMKGNLKGGRCFRSGLKERSGGPGLNKGFNKYLRVLGFGI